MFALAAVNAAYSSVQSSEALLLIGAVVVAAVWRPILKAAIALLGIAILVIIVDGAAVGSEERIVGDSAVNQRSVPFIRGGCS